MKFVFCSHQTRHCHSWPMYKMPMQIRSVNKRIIRFNEANIICHQFDKNVTQQMSDSNRIDFYVFRCVVDLVLNNFHRELNTFVLWIMCILSSFVILFGQKSDLFLLCFYSFIHPFNGMKTMFSSK